MAETAFDQMAGKRENIAQGEELRGQGDLSHQMKARRNDWDTEPYGERTVQQCEEPIPEGPHRTVVSPGHRHFGQRPVGHRNAGIPPPVDAKGMERRPDERGAVIIEAPTLEWRDTAVGPVAKGVQPGRGLRTEPPGPGPKRPRP